MAQLKLNPDVKATPKNIRALCARWEAGADNKGLWPSPTGGFVPFRSLVEDENAYATMSQTVPTTLRNGWLCPLERREGYATTWNRTIACIHLLTLFSLIDAERVSNALEEAHRTTRATLLNGHGELRIEAELTRMLTEHSEQGITEARREYMLARLEGFAYLLAAYLMRPEVAKTFGRLYAFTPERA